MKTKIIITVVLLFIIITYGCNKNDNTGITSLNVTATLKSTGVPINNAQIIVSESRDHLYDYTAHQNDGSYSMCSTHIQHNLTDMSGNAICQNLQSGDYYIGCIYRYQNRTYYAEEHITAENGTVNVNMVLDSANCNLMIRCKVNGSNIYLNNYNSLISTSNYNMMDDWDPGEWNEDWEGCNMRNYSNSGSSTNTNYYNLMPGMYYCNVTWTENDNEHHGQVTIEVLPNQQNTADVVLN